MQSLNPLTLRYRANRASQWLILEPAVVQHFKLYCQTRWYHREAGGQLFARLSDAEIRVSEATGPRRTDRRSRRLYVPDRRAEQAEITERFSRDLHYVGDWHTHRERVPSPSAVDTLSIAECFRQSEHMLNAFVLIVVGIARFPRGLHVSLHNGFDSETLTVVQKRPLQPAERDPQLVADPPYQS